MLERRIIAVEGVVQGVGFRPFVFSLATRFDLRGFVRNDAAGVHIDVEGERAALDCFVNALTAAPPPLAAIDRVLPEAADPLLYDDFAIFASSGEQIGTASGAVAVVAPDAATCDACLSELLDPASRRHRYPFTTCTACGPRLTIACASPYDRACTTMAGFPLCAACRAEYEDPHDRRFHAESLACAACGPTLEWRAGSGPIQRGEAALDTCIAALRAGAIVALKGLGGYHLACDATNGDAVALLRARKRRPSKPFALMVRDAAAARRLCEASAAEESLLGSVARPIVLLQRRRNAAVADGVAPGMPTLGVMLPATPLHHLLIRAIEPLVMTSGNMSDEPIAFRDADAMRVLGGVADAFLLHDRVIATRCDDSVTAVNAGAPAVLRRARGHAPRPLILPVAATVPLVAVGGHLKSTFCLVRGPRAFLSQHIGDLGSAAAYQALRDGLAHYSRLFDVTPQVAVHDLHPGYASTRLAEELAVEQRIGVQHHHAHIASCLAEHRIAEPAIGVAFDGTGLGTDGAIWGGEFLYVEGASFERFGHFSYVPLPGGDAAVRHPWRTALSYLNAAFGSLDHCEDLLPFRAAPSSQVGLVKQLLAGGVASPFTSSVGRLFDGVAAIAGVRQSVEFEAQAAIELEALARGDGPAYPVEFREHGAGWVVETSPIVRGVVADVRATLGTATIAARFHATLRDVIVAGVSRVSRQTGLRRVALSGGTFQNRRLAGAAARALETAGFEVLLHRRVPCNDGGLSLGQASIATRLLAEGRGRS